MALNCYNVDCLKNVERVLQKNVELWVALHTEQKAVTKKL